MRHVIALTKLNCIQMAKTPEQQRHCNIRSYGISVDLYNKILTNQNGVCWICKQLPKNGKSLNIDHCHVTKKVRGLLCDVCNRGLGLFRDSPDLIAKALLYLHTAPVHEELRIYYEQKNKCEFQDKYLKTIKLLNDLAQLAFNNNHKWDLDADNDAAETFRIALLQTEIIEHLERFVNKTK